MEKIAFIFGNGESRKSAPVDELYAKHDNVFTYGCNFFYRENVDIDMLVATDAIAQHKIYREYNGACLFMDWEPIPSEFAPTLTVTGYNILVNDYTPYGCVVNGEGEHLCMTYLRENDNITTLKETDLPILMSSGSLAMWHAAESGFETVYLFGFGDINHAIRKTLMGDEEEKKILWEKERLFLTNRYRSINWIYK